MRIVVDGLEEKVVAGTTIFDILAGRDDPTNHVIVELNGSFVHPDDYESTQLKDDDRLEVVYPAFGG